MFILYERKMSDFKLRLSHEVNHRVPAKTHTQDPAVTHGDELQSVLENP